MDEIPTLAAKRQYGGRVEDDLTKTSNVGVESSQVVLLDENGGVVEPSTSEAAPPQSTHVVRRQLNKTDGRIAVIDLSGLFDFAQPAGQQRVTVLCIGHMPGLDASDRMAIVVQPRTVPTPVPHVISTGGAATVVADISAHVSSVLVSITQGGVPTCHHAVLDRTHLRYSQQATAVTIDVAHEAFNVDFTPGANTDVVVEMCATKDTWCNSASTQVALSLVQLGPPTVERFFSTSAVAQSIRVHSDLLECGFSARAHVDEGTAVSLPVALLPAGTSATTGVVTGLENIHTDRGTFAVVLQAVKRGCIASAAVTCDYVMVPGVQPQFRLSHHRTKSFHDRGSRVSITAPKAPILQYITDGDWVLTENKHLRLASHMNPDQKAIDFLVRHAPLQHRHADWCASVVDTLDRFKVLASFDPVEGTISLEDMARYLVAEGVTQFKIREALGSIKRVDTSRVDLGEVLCFNFNVLHTDADTQDMTAAELERLKEFVDMVQYTRSYEDKMHHNLGVDLEGKRQLLLYTFAYSSDGQVVDPPEPRLDSTDVRCETTRSEACVHGYELC